MEGRRRLTLLEQMSASTNGRALAGLSLNDVLTPPIPPPPISSRTLLDIIRDEEPKSYKALIGNKDSNKPWKSFKDRLRLKKPGATWSSSVRVPTSDIPLPRHHIRSRRNSVRYVTPEPSPTTTMSNESLPADSRPPQSTNSTFNRRSSVRLSPAAIDEVESPRRHLETALSEERALSAREAVAAQEAAEAEAAKAKEEEEEEEGGGGGSESAAVTAAEPVRMSLMDLLEETDREMGLEGGRYTMDDDEDEEEEEEEEEEEQAVEVEAAAAATVAVDGDVEYSCCVCMVRHKGAAFIPCGHTFCRMCSRELFVQRGNCPLCNNFILEILDIF